MLKLVKLFLVTPLFLMSLGIEQVLAQSNNLDLERLYRNLQMAVCASNWDQALAAINPMIESSEITTEYRDELMSFRREIQNWRVTRAQFSDQPGCESLAGNTRPTGFSDETVQTVSVPSTAGSNNTEPRDSTLPGSSNTSLISECIELGNVINWSDSQARALFSRTDINDMDSLINMLSGLAGLSEQAMASLQTTTLSDAQLRTYQQSFMSVYQGFSQVTQEFVNATNTGALNNMQQSNAQIQALARQEVDLISQVNDHCGQEIISNN